MSDLKLELIRPANYKHPYKVVGFDVTDTDESLIKDANFYLKSTTRSSKTDYIISMSMHKDELKNNAKFNIAKSFLQFLPHHAIGEVVDDEYRPIDDLEIITSLVCTTMDTLAQEVPYDSIMEKNELAHAFVMLITSMTDVEYNPNPVEAEILTASDLISNIDPIMYLYQQFQSLLLSQEQIEIVNYAFWTGLTASTRCNALVFENRSKIAFSALAHANANVTESVLREAIYTSLNYFDKDHLKMEIKAILEHNVFDATHKKITISPLYLKGPRQALLNSFGYMQVKNSIAILYRAYLVFIKKKTDEKELKELNKILDVTLMKLSLNGSDAGFITILDGLFVIKKLEANDEGNNDAEVHFNEEISDLIKMLFYKS